MKNFILDQLQYHNLIITKLDNYAKASRARFLEKNPSFKFSKELTPEQNKLVEKYQNEIIQKEDIPLADLEAIELFFKEAQEASVKVQNGELETEFFSMDELKEIIFITQEEFEKCIINGKEEQL
jgi:hypothetical protein